MSNKSVKNSTPQVRMDYWFIAYIVICICSGGGLVAYLYNREQNLAAMVLLILLVCVYAFYGLRWFKGGELKGSSSGQQQWPPIVNLCPDFMAAVKGTDGSTPPQPGTAVNTYCYDPTNTYSLTSTGLRQFVPSGSTKPVYGMKIYDGASKKYPLTTATSIADITTDSNNQAIRWEGVWDGRNFATGLMPKPSA